MTAPLVLALLLAFATGIQGQQVALSASSPTVAGRRAEELESGSSLRASELKLRLRAVGVDISGIIDKEGLVKLYDALDDATKRRAAGVKEGARESPSEPAAEHVEVEVEEPEVIESANMWDELRKRAQKVGVDVPAPERGGAPSGAPLGSGALEELLRRLGFGGKGESSSDSSDVAGTNRRQFLKLAFFAATSLAISKREAILQQIGILDKDEPFFELPMVYAYQRVYAQMDALAFDGDVELPNLLVSSGAPTSFITKPMNERINGMDPVQQISLRSKEHPTLALQLNVVAETAAIGVDGVFGADNLRRFAALELDWGGGMSTGGVWATSTVRLHLKPWDDEASGRERWDLPFMTEETQRSGLPVMHVTLGLGNEAGECKGGCYVRALVDTGSPVTIVTPELAKRAGLTPSLDKEERLVMPGWSAAKTKLQPYLCPVMVLGKLEAEGDTNDDFGGLNVKSRCSLKHKAVDVFVGLTPEMRTLGFQGRSAMVLGLDVLRPAFGVGVRALAPTQGGAKTGKVVLDYYRNRLVIAR